MKVNKILLITMLVLFQLDFAFAQAYLFDSLGKPLADYNVYMVMSDRVLLTAKTDAEGKFYLPKEGISPLTGTNFVNMIICPNSTLIQEKVDNLNRGRKGIHCPNKSIYSTFQPFQSIHNLTITIIDESQQILPSGFFTPGLTLHCESKKSSYCSFILINSTKEVIMKKGFFSNFTSVDEDYIYVDFAKLKSGSYTLSSLMTNNENNHILIISFQLLKFNITNPYPEERKAILRTNEPYCSFSNGMKEVNDTFKPNETKEFVTISKEIEKTCTINYNFFPISIKNITVFSFSLVDISIVSVTIIGISILVFIFRKKIKNNKIK
ncbi:MAG: hypothetical protein Q8R04_04755 [Nanoarchaeota archaeon]|nr:hypothetical protein [Nanoarchaeota archaeon]